MTDELGSLLKLDKSHVDKAAAMTARAFCDYPLMNYFNSDASARMERLTEVFRQTVRYGLCYGQGYATSPDFEGLALWLPFSKAHRTFWRLLRCGTFFQFFGLNKGIRARQRTFGAHTGAIHQRHAAKAELYLQLLAVDPAHQGQGHGGRLLRAMFAGTDGQGVNSFLETHAPNNVEIYRHLGFEVLEETPLEGSELVTWAMLRQAPR